MPSSTNCGDVGGLVVFGQRLVFEDVLDTDEFDLSLRVE